MILHACRAIPCRRCSRTRQARVSYSSFRGATKSRTMVRNCAPENPEITARDSGFTLRVPRNDGSECCRMAINHLTPPTGNIADNVVGFSRALRAAGLPVGPGAVIDAMNALQMIEIGNRADVYATLEAIFVKRHEHGLIFSQAFDLFFRAVEDWKKM